MLRSAAKFMGPGVELGTARKSLYRTYIRAVYGVLGHRQRMVTPVCVRDFIRALFPDPAGNYMGHKDAPAPLDDTE